MAGLPIRTPRLLYSAEMATAESDAVGSDAVDMRTGVRLIDRM